MWPLGVPSCCRGTGVHSGSRSKLLLFHVPLGRRAETACPCQRKEPVPEPPSLHPLPSQPGAGWDPRHLLGGLNIRDTFGLMQWYTTIIPTARRLRQENLELEASLYHLVRPYLENTEPSLGLGKGVPGYQHCRKSQDKAEAMIQPAL